MDSLVVNGVPLLAVILGLVEFLKRLGVHDKASMVGSMLIGMVFGVLQQVSEAPAVDLAGWFGAVLYGLALGLAASGLYDLGKRFTSPSPSE